MEDECVFCGLAQTASFLVETPHFGVVWDIAPMRDGHLLIISKAHHDSLADLSPLEHHDLMTLQLHLLRCIKTVDSQFDATFIINNGILKDEGTHFHQHVIPRHPNDGFWEGQSSKAIFPKAAFLQCLNQ
jgi:diadenosine tetraphosphate (Ap4A) HIT family hydrolase